MNNHDENSNDRHHTAALSWVCVYFVLGVLIFHAILLIHATAVAVIFATVMRRYESYCLYSYYYFITIRCSLSLSLSC